MRKEKFGATIVTILLDANADVSAVIETGLTPSELAAEKNATDLVNMITEATERRAQAAPEAKKAPPLETRKRSNDLTNASSTTQPNKCLQQTVNCDSEFVSIVLKS